MVLAAGGGVCNSINLETKASRRKNNCTNFKIVLLQKIVHMHKNISRTRNLL